MVSKSISKVQGTSNLTIPVCLASFHWLKQTFSIRQTAIARLSKCDVKFVELNFWHPKNNSRHRLRANPSCESLLIHRNGMRVQKRYNHDKLQLQTTRQRVWSGSKKKTSCQWVQTSSIAACFQLELQATATVIEQVL